MTADKSRLSDIYWNGWREWSELVIIRRRNCRRWKGTLKEKKKNEDKTIKVRMEPARPTAKAPNQPIHLSDNHQLPPLGPMLSRISLPCCRSKDHWRTTGHSDSRWRLFRAGISEASVTGRAGVEATVLGAAVHFIFFAFLRDVCYLSLPNPLHLRFLPLLMFLLTEFRSLYIQNSV
jgi:hypothetical protein